jgi:hypothetical protein
LAFSSFDFEHVYPMKVIPEMSRAH